LLQVERLTAVLAPPRAGGTAEALQPASLRQLAEALCGALADPAERCRELAAMGLGAALQADPDGVADVLALAVPVIAERLAGGPPAEASEDVRLRLMQLMAGPVSDCLSRSGSIQVPANVLRGLQSAVCHGLREVHAEHKQVRAEACQPGEQRQSPRHLLVRKPTLPLPAIRRLAGLRPSCAGRVCCRPLRSSCPRSWRACGLACCTHTTGCGSPPWRL
jgi:hypothetical protein